MPPHGLGGREGGDSHTVVFVPKPAPKSGWLFGGSGPRRLPEPLTMPNLLKILLENRNAGRLTKKNRKPLLNLRKADYLCKVMHHVESYNKRYGTTDERCFAKLCRMLAKAHLILTTRIW